MQSDICKQMYDAFQRLAGDATWRAIFAEYVFHAGYEEFFQGGLLWAFNTLPSRGFSADIEKSFPPLPGNSKIDFLVFEKEDESKWRARYRAGNPLEMLGLCRGLVEIKLCRDDYASWYVSQDIKKLQQIREDPANQRFDVEEKKYLVLILQGIVLPEIGEVVSEERPTLDMATRKLDEIDNGFREGFKQTRDEPMPAGIDEPKAWILCGEPVPSDPCSMAFVRASILSAF